MDAEEVEGSSKRAGSELRQKSSKNQKTDDDKETAELQMLVEITPGEEEVAVDAIPLATKPPVIVDYKIHKEEKTNYYKITRADGSFKLYKVFSQLLKSFDREDLETLWRLVKAKHGETRPLEGYKRVLWGDLKVMFEPHVEDAVWRELREGKVMIWKLFDSCGVHFMRFSNLQVYMLVEKKYPLTPATITDMLNKKLQADHLNEIAAQRLQAELDEEVRLEREKEEEASNVALIEEWDDVQAMIDADYELAARLHAEEQGELTVEEKSRLFVELMNEKKKHFARLRAEEQRRKPLTKAQKRNQMCTYLKNMVGFTHNQLKNKSFDEVQKAFDKTMSWIDFFVSMDSKVVKGSKDKAEGSKKRTRKGLGEESVKRQKLEDDAEKAELKECLEIVLDNDEAINVEPLAIKSPIVDWKIHSLGIVSYYIVERANGSYKMYKFFSEMLKDFDRQDLLDMYKLVKERYKTIRPEAEALVLWGNFITMFEPSAEDEIWKNQEDYTLISWQLFDSCGVHSLLMDTVYIHMLVERTYPLTQLTLERMLN
ncbi:hypothetical protein Tco_1093920 [Tanacetum coccineum]|uniref:Uncharacterized protein n=1 Tax=Tanacetum coccineum TaxID=301880 RepID=A0ABQ5IE32_9ASTR